MKLYRIIYYGLLFLIFLFCFYCIYSLAVNSYTGLGINDLVFTGLFYFVLIVFSHYSPILLAKAGKLLRVTEGTLYETVITAFSCINTDKNKIRLFIKPKSKVKKIAQIAGYIFSESFCTYCSYIIQIIF